MASNLNVCIIKYSCTYRKWIHSKGRFVNYVKCNLTCVKLAWRNGSVIDYHATARGSIPGGNGVKTELYVLRKRQLMGVPSLNDLAIDGA